MSENEDLNQEEIIETSEGVENNDSVSTEKVLENEAAPDEPKAALTSDEILALEKEKYLRLYSDFENFKRRTSKERLEIFQLAGKDVILGMLPVLDDFERALKACEKLDGDAKNALDGFELIRKKMQTTLESHGLNAMVSVGLAFDPELHEAVTKIPAPSKELKGKIVDELERGYLLNEKVIRFAKVVIGE